MVQARGEEPRPDRGRTDRRGPRIRLDEALRQVEATRKLFGGSDHEPRQQVNVATVPFVLGMPMPLGPYDVRVTMKDRGTVAVSASTADRSASNTVPVSFLDGKGRLFFAPSLFSHGPGRHPTAARPRCVALTAGKRSSR